MCSYDCPFIYSYITDEYLTRESCIVAVRAWPTCRTPVTLGGGNTMENLGLPEDDDDDWHEVFGKYLDTESGLKYPWSCHQSYQPWTINTTMWLVKSNYYLTSSMFGVYFTGKGSETSFLIVDMLQQLNTTCWDDAGDRYFGDNLNNDMMIKASAIKYQNFNNMVMYKYFRVFERV